MPASFTDFFVAPEDPSVRIWRYMDFTKFVAMLDASGLYFSRADLLGDKFEGSFPFANEKFLADLSPGNVHPARTRQRNEYLRRIRLHTHVSCWHMNDYESAAMWELYGQGGRSVAISSTYQALEQALSYECLVGVVQYIDYHSDVIHDAHPIRFIVHKRKSYEHEREIRAVIRLHPAFFAKDIEDEPAAPGIWKTVDLDGLVHGVHVSPASPAWFRDLVTKVCLRFGLRREAKQSSLDEEPLI